MTSAILEAGVDLVFQELEDGAVIAKAVVEAADAVALAVEDLQKDGFGQLGGGVVHALALVQGHAAILRAMG